MTQIKIKGHKNDNCTYGINGVTFSLVSSPEVGERQCMELCPCKAFLHDAVRSYVHDGHPNTRNPIYNYGEDPDIDMNKLRLLIRINRETPKENLCYAKKVVNFYEEIAGWTQSEMTKVDHNIFKDVWLITGPKEWMQAPQLISMVTLVIRACTINGPIKFETNKDIEDTYKAWINAPIYIRDRYYIEHCWNKLFLVAKYNRELFNDITVKNLYVLNSKVYSHENGIARLCTFDTGTPKLNERFKVICEREGIKNEKSDFDILY